MLCATSGRKMPKKKSIIWDLELAKYEVLHDFNNKMDHYEFPSLVQTNMQPQNILRTRPILRREAVDS